MGSSHNHNHNHGGVIQFDQPFYYPGNVVTGTINLNIVDSISSRGVELTIKCDEGVKVIESVPRTIDEKGKLRTEFHKEEKKDKQTLFKNTNFLPNFQSNIGRGQYSYPFSFVIPNHLPGSFEYYTEEISAYIKYQVKVKILPYSDLEKATKMNSILIVRQNQSFFNYSTNLTDTRNIISFCFFNKGTATLNVSYQKNFFGIDEVIETQCNIDNTRCNVDTTSVRLQLFQKITLKIKGTHNRYFNRLITENAINERCVR